MKRLLIVGCGDIAHRLIPFLTPRYQVFALVRRVERCDKLRSLGVTPILGDLDCRSSLQRLAGLAEVVLHFAPPGAQGVQDLRTRHLLNALSRRGSIPKSLVYISTSGVYGDCNGAWVSETRPCRATSTRGQRRVDAEQQLRCWGRRTGARVKILRVPGIYAAERLPTQRLQQGLPCIVAAEDSYTNHIHADDLVHSVLAALRYGQSGRVYHVSDDAPQKMGDYFDAVADAFGYARPQRVTRAAAQQCLPSSMLSFMNESRRLHNQRLKRELKFKLRYPSVQDFLAEYLP